MNLFRNIWPPADRPPHSTNSPMAPNQPTSRISDRNPGGALSRLTGRRRSQSQSQSQVQPSHNNAARPHSSSQRKDLVPQYSEYSTQGPFHNRMFFSENFMLGAGAVIIQPSSGKVVVVQDGDSWFLPKGRKDLGESLEQAALREAYEESGYRCEFSPLYHWTNAPVESRLAYGQRHTEPLYVTITSYLGRRNRPPGEYLTFWYVCQVGPEAVRELGTGMPDEAGYVGHLVTFEVAGQLLGELEGWVLAAARNEWVRSEEIDRRIPAAGAQQREEGQQSNPNNDGERT